MEKDKLDTVDFMSFINSMSKLDEMNAPKKKKNSKCVVKETDEDANGEEVAVNKDIKETEDDDVTTDSDGSEGSDGSDVTDEEDVDVDEDDSDEDDDEDNEEDFDLTDENLYNLFNSFFTDEYGVNVATSMSNIAYELHSLNKNLSKMLKDKEKK